MMTRMVNLITVPEPTALEKIMAPLLDTLTCKVERFFLLDVNWVTDEELVSKV
jgi:hypothetical protein